MPPEAVIGWDLGGAHLKAARLAADGSVARAVQLPCRLWLGIEELDRALAAALEKLGDAPRHAVTMTGELADCFPDRAAGVAGLVEAACARLGEARVAVFAGPAGFIEPAAARAAGSLVASANWLASALLLASCVGDALLVDIGSTTCDIVPVSGGEVAARGRDDAGRLAAGELVYSGAVRTPLMAVAQRVPFAGQWLPLMAEHFATTADVHRLAGGLPPDADQQPSADSRGKSPEDSARRLARMVGMDAGAAPAGAWVEVARYLAEAQLRTLHDAACQVLSAAPLPPAAPLVGAGVGAFIARRLAQRIGRPWQDFGAAVGASGEWSSECAPAVAVAALLQRGAGVSCRS